MADSIVFTDIEEAIGTEKAIAFATAYPGVDVYIPHAVDKEHPFSVVLGLESAQRLASTCGGQNMTVPTSEKRKIRDAQVLMLFREKKMSTKQIALITGQSQRNVRYILSRLLEK